MFLKYNSSSISYSHADPSDSEYIPPSSLSFIDCSIPVKSLNGSKSGPTMHASMFESIHFRQNSAATLKQSAIDSMISRAHELDLACEGDEFIPSDEGYVSLFNCLNAVKADGMAIKGDIVWSNTVPALKQNIHRYGCSVLEMYLANSFLTANATGKFDIPNVGNGEIKVGDYTKAFVAFGYDSTGVIVMNSLGLKWGSLGFARLAWKCFEDSSTVLLPNGENERCFIKAASFKGCFN